MTDLWKTSQGKLSIDLHYGQTQMWESERRFILMLAGTQSGKTSSGPLWLWREMQLCGPGDYMVVTPTFTMLELKALPELLKFFQRALGLGRYVSSPVRKFIVSPAGARRLWGADADEASIFFGYAADPESLESATAKGIWCDEAGQKRFKLESWEALNRRASLNQARILLSTTPYDLGWLKKKLYDPWQKGARDIDVINFASIMNPAFPRAEYERAARELPDWKFRMFYQGRFERPAGLIYDSFIEGRHTIPPFAIPDHWQRYMGIDFGGINTAAVFYAEEPTSGKLYLYRTYRGGQRSAAEHAKELLKGEPMIPFAVGGSKSEGQWRREFAMAGLSVREPDISEVEVGISRVYAAHKRDQIIVFDTLDDYLSEKGSYSRELNKDGEPTEAIEDKSTYHILDAERYIIGRITRGLE